MAASSTPEQRAALFDTILARTMRREAFSEIKNERLGLNVEAAMRAERDRVIAAENDVDLFYALSRVSAARRDRHLSVEPVDGGLDPAADRSLGGEVSLRFTPDYGDPDDPVFFVVDRAPDPVLEEAAVSVGDRLLSVNGRSADAWYREAAPYMRASTVAGLRWKLAGILSQRSIVLPPSFYEETLSVQLERADGTRYELALPYRSPDQLQWEGLGAPRYPGFERVRQTPTFTLYRSREHEAIVLSWVGFREHMVEDVDWLMAWAEREGILDWNVIFDATRSGGGSRGAYTIRRLSSRPFRTTFGNLRLSDAAAMFVEQAKERAGRLLDSGVREADDDGRWLLEWLETDVARAFEQGLDYTDDVPFKLAHAPKDSDGVLQPAEVHFTGELAVLLGPDGGSHLDQFAAIVVDNQLGTVIGMPAGGYSNTWEWEEVLTMPGSGHPVVRFMWSIGHTIRPNGEVLEGNPAEVDEWIPLTRDNAAVYYDVLMDRALEILSSG